MASVCAPAEVAVTFDSEPLHADLETAAPESVQLPSARGGEVLTEPQSDAASPPQVLSVGDQGLAISPEPQTPNPEPRTPKPELPAAVPDRIYFYEVAAEEVAYPEPEILVDYGGSDGAAANVGALPQAQPVVDEVLPFEVRPKSKSAPGASKQCEGSEKAAPASPAKPQTKLPGI